MFLKNQVKLRDNILYEQKLVLDRNQVDANISYEGLKDIDRIEASMKRSADDALPVLGARGGRIQSGVRPGRPNSNYNNLARRNSFHSASQPRLPLIGAKGGFQAARNRCMFSSDSRLQTNACLPPNRICRPKTTSRNARFYQGENSQYPTKSGQKAYT